MIKIALAEDHGIVRDGIRSILDKEADLKVISEASNGYEALDKINYGTIPDVLITDINMPGLRGLELAEQVTSAANEIKVIILTMHDNEEYVLKAFDSGAAGYLLKSVSREEMLFAIRHIVSGNRYLSSELSAKLLTGLRNQHDGVPSNEPLPELSKRETEILKLIAEGMTNMEISDKLFTSRRTVEGHRLKLIQKTGAKNTAALIRYAIRYKLLD